MRTLSTLLAERVESLIPHTSAAACIPPSPWCSSHCDKIDGSCLWLHRTCHYSCHGGAICGSWYTGKC
jgi:hypothetical protein